VYFSPAKVKELFFFLSFFFLSSLILILISFFFLSIIPSKCLPWRSQNFFKSSPSETFTLITSSPTLIPSFSIFSINAGSVLFLFNAKFPSNFPNLV